MSEQQAVVRVVDVIFELSDAGSVRMQELVNQHLEDDHIVEHVLDNSDLITAVLEKISSEDLIEQVERNGAIDEMVALMPARDLACSLIYNYGTDDFLELLETSDILDHVDNEDIVDWVMGNMDAGDFISRLSGTEIMDYMIDNRIISPAVTELSNRYHDQGASILQMRDNMSAQTYDFNQAQARIGDLVRHNEEQARIIAAHDASVDPMVAPVGSDPEFEALLYDEQVIADRNVLRTELDESLEELAIAILGDNPTIVGNDPR